MRIKFTGTPPTKLLFCVAQRWGKSIESSWVKGTYIHRTTASLHYAVTSSLSELLLMGSSFREGLPVWKPDKIFAESPQTRPEGTIRPEAVYRFLPWKPKQPETNGCSNMAIEILYIGNGCLGKHPFVSGCLVSQVGWMEFSPGSLMWPRSSFGHRSLQIAHLRHPVRQNVCRCGLHPAHRPHPAHRKHRQTHRALEPSTSRFLQITSDVVVVETLL